MMLEGQCRIDFEPFYIKQLREQRPDYNKYSDAVLLAKFYRKPDNEKYGVYVDWFDSCQIQIGVKPSYLDYAYDYVILGGHQSNIYVKLKEGFKTLTEARQKAILKACEIYNNQER